MIRARTIEAAGTGGGALADTICLTSDDRRRRRIVMQCAGGTGFLLDLPQAGRLRAGDVLVLDDGRRIGVAAASEPLCEIRAQDGAHLTLIAYHLGNRHLEAQVFDDRILIRRDHVIEDMVRGLGGATAHVQELFEPESGAYGHRGAGHSHAHGHDHAHRHGDD